MWASSSPMARCLTRRQGRSPSPSAWVGGARGVVGPSHGCSHAPLAAPQASLQASVVRVPPCVPPRELLGAGHERRCEPALVIVCRTHTCVLSAQAWARSSRGGTWAWRACGWGTSARSSSRRSWAMVRGGHDTARARLGTRATKGRQIPCVRACLLRQEGPAEQGGAAAAGPCRACRPGRACHHLLHLPPAAFARPSSRVHLLRCVCVCVCVRAGTSGVKGAIPPNAVLEFEVVGRWPPACLPSLPLPDVARSNSGARYFGCPAGKRDA